MNLKEFADKLDRLAHGSTRDEFFLSCTDELSARLLSKVQKRTPVGPGEFRVTTDKEVNKGRRLYSNQSGVDEKGETHYSIEKTGKTAKGVKLIKLRSGGLLRRSWQAIKAKGSGRTYSAKVFNPIEYASFVEYGHRQHVGQFVPVLGKRLKRAWIPGQHMLQNSRNELSKSTDKILQRRLDAWLKGGLK